MHAGSAAHSLGCVHGDDTDNGRQWLRGQSPRRSPRSLLLPCIWVAAGGLILAFGLRARQPARTLAFSQLLQAVEHGEVRTAVVSADGAVAGALRNGGAYTSQIPVALRDSSLTPTLMAHGVTIAGTAPGVDWLAAAGTLLPILLVVAAMVFFGRRARQVVTSDTSRLTSVAAASARVYGAERPSTRFADVAGYAGAKHEITEVVHYLREPERYARAGARGPRGVLMVGPPGTGKTLVARAVAGEAAVPFFALAASSFVEVYVGVGAARVRSLFEEARSRAPAIVFIDEIDAIGQRRGRSALSNDEREQTLNQLLAEMDGFEQASGVVVLAATNRPETLDPALRRPGRFDREVVIPLPNLSDRLEILRVHARGKQLAPEVDLLLTARATPGFSGADLANLLNEAAIGALRCDRVVVCPADLVEARTRVTLGRREAASVLLPDEQRSVAVHEAGHALVAALSDHADPVSSVTILPAGRSLGATELLPLEERHLHSRSYLQDGLAVRLGGRAAEILLLGEPTTGAADDLASATELAGRMICDYDMSERFGPLRLSTAAPSFLGDDDRSVGCAEATHRQVDLEVMRLLRTAEQRAGELLDAHREQLWRLVELLLEHEVVDGADVYALVGRPSPR